MNNRQEMRDSYAAIRIGEKRHNANETRWSLLLLLFKRIVAILWLFEGLMQWRMILMSHQLQFDGDYLKTSLAAIGFAAVDLAAAIGLWLGGRWGGVLWLMVALTQIIVIYTLPSDQESHSIVLLNSFLIGMYLFLAFQTARDPYRPSRIGRFFNKIRNSFGSIALF